MNGAGNDFVVVDNRFYAFTPAEFTRLARTLCRRHEGIGADGLLALDAPADEATHHYRMHYHNADGSRGSMCGNGARCLARYARLAGIEGDPLVFDTDAGTYRAEVPEDVEADVTLHVPPPRGFRGLDGEDARFIWTGTEHAVVFCESVENAPVAEEGLRLRHSAQLAPAGANVNFVQVQASGPPRLRVRTFEKGVEAETRACGTGALASALVAVFEHRVDGFPVEVHMPGGTLTVGATRTGDAEVENLTLAGPAEVTFRGTVEWGG